MSRVDRVAASFEKDSEKLGLEGRTPTLGIGVLICNVRNGVTDNDDHDYCYNSKLLIHWTDNGK